MQAREIRISGLAVLAQRVTYVGELGWELYANPEWAGQVWDRLMEAGAEFGITPGGYRVLDSLRMEQGYRYYSRQSTALFGALEACAIDRSQPWTQTLGLVLLTSGWLRT